MQHLTRNPPRALPLAAVRGCYRRSAEDFVVDEILAFEPCGEGEHLWLHVEKRDQNSEAVAAALAAGYGVPAVAVSFAGRKDRRAVARQWFSVHTFRDDVASPLPDGCRVLGAARHGRKLRRGELGGNRFRIRLCAITGDVGGLDDRLSVLPGLDVPNYFGPQRFGFEGDNVPRAFAWLLHRPRRAVSHFEKGLHLSVGRALVFNAVLAHRVALGTWNRALPGDVLEDGRATGPLWGRGRSATGDCAAAVERAALADFGDWCHALEHVGLAQARRGLSFRPRGLVAAREGDVVTLEFTLGPGEYATALLREIGDFVAVRGDGPT